MGLIELAIVAPEIVIAGRDVEITVEVRTEDALEVRGIDLQLVGGEGYFYRDSSSSRYLESYIDTRVQLHGAGTISAGRHSFVGRFAIPAKAPPTHDIAPAFAWLKALARIRRGWFSSDPVKAAWLRVHRASSRPPSGEPETWTAGEGDRRIDVSVASTGLVTGEQLAGTVAAHARGGTTLLVQLVAVTAPGPLEAVMQSGTVVIPAGADGEPRPFELRLPPSMMPSFSSRTQSWRWLLRVSGPEVQVDIPLDIVELAPGVIATPLSTTIPGFDSSRIATAFASFADENRWTPVARDRDSRLGVIHFAIAQADSGAGRELGYAYSAPGGWSVIARASYPRLGLLLDVDTSSRDRDRSNTVTARFDDQATSFVDAVEPALSVLLTLGELVRWNDDEIVFAVVTVVPQLDTVAAELARVLAAITTAAQGVLPPPIPDLDVTGWRALAASLGGHLVIGDLSIDDGTIDACPVHVRVDWRDQLPASIIATVGPAADASDAVRAIAVTSRNPARIAETSVAPAVVEVVSTWPADIVDLRIHDGIASASRPFGPPATASELVGCLRRVIAAMEPRYGAYR